MNSNKNRKNFQKDGSSKGNKFKNSRSNGKSKYNGNGNGNNKSRVVDDKTSTDSETREPKTTVCGMPNDPSWYNKYPELINMAGNFSYGYPLGSIADLSNVNYPYAGKFICSGIMTLDVIPFYGVSKQSDSPINQAIRKMYTYIRHANSGAKNYDPADLGMYIGAMDSIYTMFWYAVRAYGTARLYNPVNRYLPVQLLKAQGFDPDDMLRNSIKLITYLNTKAAQINNLVVPDTMELFKRHRWLFSGIYLDSVTAKAQAYLMRPAGYYKFTVTEENPVGRLEYETLGWGDGDVEGNLFTVESFIDTFEAMVKPILTNYDEDFGTISGDIMKAYDVSQLYRLPSISLDYTTILGYSLEVLTQFQNATILGNPITNLTIYQDPNPTSPNAGAILCDPTVQTTVTIEKGNKWGSTTEVIDVDIERGVVNDFSTAMMTKLVTLPFPNPKPMDTVIATRLSAVLGPATDGKLHAQGKDDASVDVWSYHKLVAAGTELVVRGHLYKIDKSTGADVPLSDMTFDSDIILPVDTTKETIPSLNVGRVMSRVVRLSHFDYHPTLTVTRAEVTLGEGNGFGTAEFTNIEEFNNFDNYYLVDVDNYTMISGPEMEQLHEVAILSLLDI